MAAALNLIAVAFIYGGGIAVLIGLVSLIRPLRWLGVRSRKRGAAAIAVGAVIVVAGFATPAPLERVDEVHTDLDRAMPAWQFREVHRIHVSAPPAEAYRAILAVTADEILLYRTLTWIRSPHIRAPARETILAPGRGKPIIEVMRSGFLPMSENPGREIVLATVFLTGARPRIRVDDPKPQDFIELTAPGYAKVTINFRVEPADQGTSDVITETRVFATDPRSTRNFAAYWRVIYPGSALIRRMWLRAIAHRAEASS